MNRRVVITGILLIVTAIILGAFGAHALKAVLGAEQLNSFETGVRYQMYNGLALLVLGLNAVKFSFSIRWATGLMLAGVLLFSGSIYGLSLQPVLGVKLSFLGPVTPIGGLLMIVSWVLLLLKLVLNKSEAVSE